MYVYFELGFAPNLRFFIKIHQSIKNNSENIKHILIHSSFKSLISNFQGHNGMLKQVCL